MNSAMTQVTQLRPGQTFHRAMRFWEVISLGEETDDGRIRLNLQDTKDGEPRSILIHRTAEVRAWEPRN